MLTELLVSYRNQIPENTFTEIVSSGAFAAILGAVVSGEKKFSLMAGLLSASATTISSLVTPLFRGQAAQQPNSTDAIIGEFARTSLGIIGTGLISIFLGRIPNVPCETVTGALNVFLAIQGLKGGDLSKANGILVVPGLYPIR